MAWLTEWVFSESAYPYVCCVCIFNSSVKWNESCSYRVVQFCARERFVRTCADVMLLRTVRRKCNKCDEEPRLLQKSLSGDLLLVLAAGAGTQPLFSARYWRMCYGYPATDCRKNTKSDTSISLKIALLCRLLRLLAWNVKRINENGFANIGLHDVWVPNFAKIYANSLQNVFIFLIKKLNNRYLHKTLNKTWKMNIIIAIWIVH